MFLSSTEGFPTAVVAAQSGWRVIAAKVSNAFPNWVRASLGSTDTGGLLLSFSPSPSWLSPSVALRHSAGCPAIRRTNSYGRPIFRHQLMFTWWPDTFEYTDHLPAQLCESFWDQSKKIVTFEKKGEPAEFNFHTSWSILVTNFISSNIYRYTQERVDRECRI